MATDDQFYREFEHTGDIGFEVEASTRAELFARTATAMARLMVAPEGIEALATRIVRASASNDEDLMHDLLAAALNIFLVDGFIWRDAQTSESSDEVVVSLSGEP